jgi:hypothetical protein
VLYEDFTRRALASGTLVRLLPLEPLHMRAAHLSVRAGAAWQVHLAAVNNADFFKQYMRLGVGAGGAGADDTCAPRTEPANPGSRAPRLLIRRLIVRVSLRSFGWYPKLPKSNWGRATDARCHTITRSGSAPIDTRNWHPGPVT